MKTYNYGITTYYKTILQMLKNLRERAASAALRSLVLYKTLLLKICMHDQAFSERGTSCAAFGVYSVIL